MIIQTKESKYIDKNLYIEQKTYNDFYIVPTEIFIGAYQIIQIVNGYLECFDIDTNEIFKHPSGSICIVIGHTICIKNKKGNNYSKNIVIWHLQKN